MATINEILNAIKVSRDQGFSEADIATGLARYGITASQIENATAKTYTPTQIENAINVSRQQGFSDADITTGLAKYGITTAQPYVDPNSGRATGLTDPSKFTPSTYTPAQIADAIKVSRQQGFSEADIITGLGRFLPNAAAVTAALAANPKASPVIPTIPGAITPIARPQAPRQFTNTQLTPASVTNTAITGTPYTNVYSPATMQQNAPTLAQISAASQSANPYQSLMALTPQRSMSPAYAAQAGQTAANTNLGGFNPAIYNPAATPVTGLLNTTGNGSVNGGGESGVSSNPGWDALSDVQKSQFYSDNPNFQAVTQFGQKALGFLGLNDAKQAAIASGAAAAAQATATANAAANEATGGGGGYGSGSGPGGSGTSQGGYGPQYRGGLITPRDVKGPNPPGPDDGHASLDIGEYVIRKSAVKKYGSNIFEQINAGRIPAQRLKSLLE